MSCVQGLLRFLWDFVVGDDWRIAAAVAIGLILELVLSDNGASIWWLLPAVVVAVLCLSVWSAVRNRS
ncbi:MAG TPA: hypothetical protein VGC05_12125 [Mycobacterium sp.]